MKAEQVFSETMRDFQKLLRQQNLTLIMDDQINAKIDVKKRQIIFSVKKKSSK